MFVILFVCICSWTPNHFASEAIGHCIRSQFRGPYHHYDVMPEEDKLKWWTDFQTRVTWAPHDECQIKKVYESKVKKRLCDMLTKARRKAVRPIWIGQQAWVELLNYWDSQKFKDKSTQNKANRSSARGGALHSTGRKSHSDIAVTLERQYGRPPEPDELFMATHTNKKGEWVDSRARETYEKYHERLKVLQANSSQDSNTDVHQLDPATKLQTWKEAAGGKSRGRVYGTADLAANIRQGVSSLTQASASDTSQSGQVTENQMLRAELSMWSQKYAHLEDELKVIKDKLISMDQEKTTSNSTTQFHHEYDPEQDDQPIS
ncbi:uncharacterized protein [Phaseolus vulgaris]|uniref:uncharacterized protein n=1 Tax=Phaseolus vulgaris TaxID=3885 RepID=UPI0035C94960